MPLKTWNRAAVMSRFLLKPDRFELVKSFKLGSPVEMKGLVCPLLLEELEAEE